VKTKASSFPGYKFEARNTPDSEWRGMPVTWMSSDDDAVRAACVSVQGARQLVAKCNAEDGWSSHRVVSA